MELTPRYEGPAVLRFDPPPADPAVPLLRQRRRLVATVAGLDGAQWDAPSRCAGWTCRDVVRHLVGANPFWAFSIGAGRTGEPTRLLVGFDPVATPAGMVAGAPETTTDELVAALSDSTEALAAALDGIHGAGWARPAEAPPGHLAISEVTVHALWDAWIHERDICLPLGIDVPEEPDEVDLCLRYAAALGPALLASGGATRTGAFRVTSLSPPVDLVVEIGPSVVVRDAGTAAGDDAFRSCAGTPSGSSRPSACGGTGPGWPRPTAGWSRPSPSPSTRPADRRHPPGGTRWVRRWRPRLPRDPRTGHRGPARHRPPWPGRRGPGAPRRPGRGPWRTPGS